MHSANLQVGCQSIFLLYVWVVHNQQRGGFLVRILFTAFQSLFCRDVSRRCWDNIWTFSISFACMALPFSGRCTLFQITQSLNTHIGAPVKPPLVQFSGLSRFQRPFAPGWRYCKVGQLHNRWQNHMDKTFFSKLKSFFIPICNVQSQVQMSVPPTTVS